MKSKNYGHEDGKTDWTLLLDDFHNAIKEVLKAREYGAKKYDRDNWKLSMGTEDHDFFLAKNRASRFRHMFEQGIDKESGCHHRALDVLRGLIELEYILGKKD